MREMRKYRDYLIEELSDSEEATAYLEVSKEEYEKDGDAVAFLLALQSIAEAQAENNELASQVYLLSGDVHRSRGEHDLAIEDYDTVIKLTNIVIEMNPNDIEAYIHRGIAYHHKGEYNSAVANFTKAIELDPSIPQLYLARCVAYHQKGEYGYAIENVTKALELNPDNAEAYQHRALAYQRKGDYDRSKGDYDHAIADFTKAIELESNNTKVYCGRGHVYQSKGDYDHAIADFTKAIELNPNDARAYSGRGFAYQSKGEHNRAIEDATKAVELNPQDANIYNHRGIIYYYKGDYDDAIEDYAKAVSLNPNYARAYNNRGAAYCDKGEVDLAIMDFNKAIQLNPNYAEAYYNRGVAYRVKSLMNRAIEDYNRAIQLNPNYADVYKKHWETWLPPEAREETGSTVNPLEGITITDTIAGINVSKWRTSHPSQETIEGVTRIVVSGFKSLAEECAIDIRPLTILAGANSSGKSSIMQPLLLLKQTLELEFDPGPLWLEGPNVQFTEAEQFLSKLVNKERADRFQIRIGTQGFDSYLSTTTIFRKGQSGIELVEMTREDKSEDAPPWYPKHITLYPEMSPEGVKSLAEQHLIPKGSDVVGRSRCFLHFESQDGYTSLNITSNLESYIFNSIHLPGLRRDPERIYKLTSTGPRYPGTFDHYVASIIHNWQNTEDDRLKTLINTLRRLGLTGQVSTKKIGDSGIEIKVGLFTHDKTRETDMVSIADVGLGVSQVLPVLVALIVAKPGQLVYLEQPELHLHPRAQVVLARVLANAAKSGVRVVAETHSSLLLLAVQTLVAEGDLSPELVKLHWFTRGEDGATKITPADLDEAGAYGDWPEDFDDVDLKTQSRYIKAAQSRLAERA